MGDLLNKIRAVGMSKTASVWDSLSNNSSFDNSFGAVGGMLSNNQSFDNMVSPINRTISNMFRPNRYSPTPLQVSRAMFEGGPFRQGLGQITPWLSTVPQLSMLAGRNMRAMEQSAARGQPNAPARTQGYPLGTSRQITGFDVPVSGRQQNAELRTGWGPGRPTAKLSMLSGLRNL